MVLSKEKEQEYIKKVREDAMFLEEIENQTEAICLEAVRQNGYKISARKPRGLAPWMNRTFIMI